MNEFEMQKKNQKYSVSYHQR